MNLSPLLAASPVIQIHAAAAFGAFGLGTVQMLAPKGTIPHRTFGWLWVALMMTVAVSSLFIHTIRSFGPFSPVHLLSVLVLVKVPVAVYFARRHRIAGHRQTMTSLFVLALIVAGIFTFMPGRIMHAVVFGGSSSG